MLFLNLSPSVLLYKWTSLITIPLRGFFLKLLDDLAKSNGHFFVFSVENHCSNQPKQQQWRHFLSPQQEYVKLNKQQRKQKPSFSDFKFKRDFYSLLQITVELVNISTTMEYFLLMMFLTRHKFFPAYLDLNLLQVLAKVLPSVFLKAAAHVVLCFFLNHYRTHSSFSTLFLYLTFLIGV